MNADTNDPVAANARLGDRVAFEVLVRLEKAGLYAFVRRYIGDPDDAFDIVQDSFIAAWRAIGRYDANRPFSTWLKTIALNKCRDHGRRSAVRRVILRAFAVEPQAQNGDGDNIGAPGDDELARLDRAVARLPALYKEPLLLTTTGGLSHEEAAKVLKTTAKAIEMRLRRGRQRLTEMLASSGEG